MHALKLKPEYVIACQSMSEHAFRTWEMTFEYRDNGMSGSVWF